MRYSTILCLLLVSMPAVASYAAGNAILDQSMEHLSGFTSTTGVFAQVFTVGRKGILDRVEVPIRLNLDLSPGRYNFLEMHLLRTEDNDGILTSIFGHRVAYRGLEAPVAGAPYIHPNPDWPVKDFQWVAFENIGLPVDTGDEFAIAVNMENAVGQKSYFDWVVTFPGRPGYSGGKPWGSGTVNGGLTRSTHIQDFGFRTFVIPVPEPTGFVTATGCIGLLLIALRRRK